MDKPPRADIRGIQAGPNFVQPAQARNYAQHLRDLAIQWDAAADLCERLRAEARTGPVDKGRPIPLSAHIASSPDAAASTPPVPPS